MLNKDEYERYNRNIIIKDIGIDGQFKLFNSKVLVCGAGGLGSAVISSLTSIGVGSIGIIDNDNIELSNLNRQFIHHPENIGVLKVNSAKNWIQKYNPQVKVNIYPIRLNPDNCNEILNQYDIIADCFDSFKSKFMLNKACIKNNKTMIHAGVTEFSGQVMTIIPGNTPCLNCLFPEYNENIQYDNIKGVLSPIVNTIGSIQALEIVKTLLNFKKLLVNSFLSYDGLEQSFRRIDIKQNKHCPVCGKLVLI